MLKCECHRRLCCCSGVTLSWSFIWTVCSVFTGWRSLTWCALPYLLRGSRIAGMNLGIHPVNSVECLTWQYFIPFAAKLHTLRQCHVWHTSSALLQVGPETEDNSGKCSCCITWKVEGLISHHCAAAVFTSGLEGQHTCDVGHFVQGERLNSNH